MQKRREGERERECYNLRMILNTGDKLRRAAHYDCRRPTSIGSASLKGEKPERSTRRSRIYLNQKEILDTVYLFRERTKNASHLPDEKSER